METPSFKFKYTDYVHNTNMFAEEAKDTVKKFLDTLAKAQLKAPPAGKVELSNFNNNDAIILSTHDDYTCDSTLCPAFDANVHDMIISKPLFYEDVLLVIYLSDRLHGKYLYGYIFNANKSTLRMFNTLRRMFCLFYNKPTVDNMYDLADKGSLLNGYHPWMDTSTGEEYVLDEQKFTALKLQVILSCMDIL